MFAGGIDGINYYYYLRNGKSYWTMSPADTYSIYARVLCVDESGVIRNGYSTSRTGINLRPVINLKNDIQISGGNGTLENPYIVS